MLFRISSCLSVCLCVSVPRRGVRVCLSWGSGVRWATPEPDWAARSWSPGLSRWTTCWPARVSGHRQRFLYYCGVVGIAGKRAASLRSNAGVRWLHAVTVFAEKSHLVTLESFHPSLLVLSTVCYWVSKCEDQEISHLKEENGATSKSFQDGCSGGRGVFNPYSSLQSVQRRL